MTAVASAAERHVAVVTAAEIHSCIGATHFPREHGRLNEDNVRHRQKRCHTGQNLGAYVGFVFRQLE